MGPSIINSAHQELAVSEIKPHPSNARRGDLAAISASIKANGFYGSLVVNKRTSHILAGNHRYLAAVDLGFETVPVTWVDVDAAQELRILAADNRTSELGTFDHDLLDSLLESIGDDLVGTGYELPDFDDLSMFAEDIEKEEDSQTASQEATADLFVPDTVWPSDNRYGVPQLASAMQATLLDAPVLVWGDQARSKAAGTYLFYTDDYKFEALWKDPSKLVASGTPVATEPNYSTGQDTPPAVALWGIYRKRWINRWWQSQGVKTLVDLNVQPELWEWSLLGVPPSWRAWATRLHTGDDWQAWLGQCWDLVTGYTGTDEGHLFVVYGGGREVRQHCIDKQWWWIPERKQVFDGKWSQKDFVTSATHTRAQGIGGDHGAK